jgi:N-acetyl-alpha-D-glucosaminyl L-malate synthase BshA
LHGTDTTLLGADPGYGPAIRHALQQSDAVTTVSKWLENETRRVLGFDGPIEVIHNFFEPGIPQRSREEVRQELDVRDEQVLLIHSSNLRPVKRIDLLLETVAHLKKARGESFKLLVLAGSCFAPFVEVVRRLGLENSIIVRENITDIEDYVQAADIGVYTSASESFCLSILEGMFFSCPSVSTSVGGIPEVIEDGESGLLVASGNSLDLAAAIDRLIEDKRLRLKLGSSAKAQARQKFSAEVIVPQYEALYRQQVSKLSAVV